MRSSILARIPGFRQRIIPEPHVPEIGRDVSKNQVGFGIIREILAGSGILFHRGKWDS
jgi:hypothetical protein